MWLGTEFTLCGTYECRGGYGEAAAQGDMSGQVGRIRGAGGQHVANAHRAEGVGGQAARLDRGLRGQNLQIWG